MSHFSAIKGNTLPSASWPVSPSKMCMITLMDTESDVMPGSMFGGSVSAMRISWAPPAAAPLVAAGAAVAAGAVVAAATLVGAVVAAGARVAPGAVVATTVAAAPVGAAAVVAAGAMVAPAAG